MARVGLSGARLAQAGAELADEVGFEQVTVSALARHFGVQVASLYSHVRSSDDLKARIATVTLTELADQAAAALAGRAGRDALHALADVYRDYARAHPGRYAATRHTAAASEPYVAAGRRHSELVRAVLRGYDLGEPAQTDAVRLLGSTIHGYITLELAGSFAHSEPSAGDSWPRIIDALDTLLRSWS
ncbi:TetR/AcrR family transcriptional regulator [Kribbella speibonae]|uniref:TetR/AcrR family transcriptional regulator n=1 Tax=Kribbella speibonae TaxID=1572660 RepID=A0A4V2M3P6_9ACTN|nr:TetR/AcrR family transcriptional regulator [Kribbella speibonae]TCC32842.1 TetR/AcrR family transcriptional regulator [Kribbella speibonae]